nr:PREDICTED: uncharacterized protein LOC102272053 [Bos mutus]
MGEPGSPKEASRSPGVARWLYLKCAPGPTGLEGPLEHVRHILLVVWAALPGLHVSTLCSESSTPLGLDPAAGPPTCTSFRLVPRESVPALNCAPHTERRALPGRGPPLHRAAGSGPVQGALRRARRCRGGRVWEASGRGRGSKKHKLAPAPDQAVVVLNVVRRGAIKGERSALPARAQRARPASSGKAAKAGGSAALSPSKKRKNSKKKNQPGKYSQLVVETIRRLGERNGSSLAKIYAEAKKVAWFDQQNGRTYLKYSIKALVQNDTLLQVKGTGANKGPQPEKRSHKKGAASKKDKGSKAKKAAAAGGKKVKKAAKPSVPKVPKGRK